MEQILYYLMVLSTVLLISFVVFFISYSFRKERNLSDKFWSKDISKILISLCVLTPISFVGIFLGGMSVGADGGGVDFYDLTILVPGFALILYTLSLFLGGVIDIIVRIHKR